MKHNATYPTLAALLLTLAFAGCKQEPLPESGDAIRFAVTPAVTSGLQTKADPSVEADLIADGKTSTVWGSLKTGSADWEKVFENQPQTVTCSKEGSSVSWNYGATRYWVRKASYRFCSVFPTTADVQSGSGSDKVIVNYPSLPGYDLMVASSPLIDAATNGNNPVNLKFQHTGAAVRFLFAKDANDTKTYSITGLTLQNISASGSMTYMGASNDGGASISWTPGTPGSASPWTGSPWAVPASTSETPFAVITTPEWLFAVPQDLAATSTTVFPAITVSYTVADQALEVTLPLKTNNIAQWESGKAYTYKIFVNPNAIELNVEWTDWVDGGEDTMNTGKTW